MSYTKEVLEIANVDDLNRSWAECRGLLLTIASRMVGAQNSEDVLQFAFIKVFQRVKKQKKPIEKPVGFLTTTVRSVVISEFIRKGKSRKESKHVDWDSLSFEGYHDEEEYTAVESAESVSIRQERLQTLARVIDQLPDNYREAFVRRRVWGETCREIAKVMGIEETTAANYAAIGFRLIMEHCKENRVQL